MLISRKSCDTSVIGNRFYPGAAVATAVSAEIGAILDALQRSNLSREAKELIGKLLN